MNSKCKSRCFFSIVLLIVAQIVAPLPVFGVLYNYDSLNRLTNVDYGNGSVISYTYDAAGNRLTYSGAVANDAVAPTIAITSPTSGPSYTNDSPTISLSGTASDNTGILMITWANDRGGIGVAAGTNNWSIAGIPLKPGINEISVTAWDFAGNGTPSWLLVNYVVPVSIRQLTDMSVSNRMFLFTVNGHPGSNYLISVSSDLIHWTPFSTNTMPPQGLMAIMDPNKIIGQRFYRVQPTSEAPLNLITVTLQSSGSGSGYFTVDGSDYGSPQTFNWTSGSCHTIAANAIPSGSSHILVTWTAWSDGGAMSHIVCPTTSTNYTANFKTQCWLDINAGTGGTVSPASGWYDYGQTVVITATPSAGYQFNGWTSSNPQTSGTYSGMNNPATITVNTWFSETADFIASP